MLYYLILSFELFGGAIHNEHLYTYKDRMQCMKAANEIEPVMDKYLWDTRIAKDVTAVCVTKKKGERVMQEDILLEVVSKN